MQILRLLNRKATLPWARVQVISNPDYCGKSIVCQGRKGRKVDISLSTRSAQADNKKY